MRVLVFHFQDEEERKRKISEQNMNQIKGLHDGGLEKGRAQIFKISTGKSFPHIKSDRPSKSYDMLSIILPVSVL